MGYSVYFIISFLLLSSLVLSQAVLADHAGDLAQQRGGERNSKLPYRDPIKFPICRRQQFCPPATASKNP